ncbi:MAG: xanthine dehydrogenase family protein molybdopterin-binding subunit [Betaproteobacteria bacterium]|nr:xanthine dehydrogenase family protein molybdopterin-binding subunit [Betaproteobacteria bacterium]
MSPRPRSFAARRAFLKSSVLSSAALVIGISAPLSGLRRALAQTPSAASDPAPIGQWLAMSREGIVTIASAKVEMGQGAFTAWSMIVAEELALPLSALRIGVAPADPGRYRDPLLQKQATWGSTGVMAFFDSLSEAAAAMRESLIDAATKKWNVPAGECSVREGKVWHAGSARSAAYGTLAADAARQARPTGPRTKPKPREANTLVGRATPRTDTRAKSTGQAKFGLDVSMPGLKTAVFLQPPRIGATLKSFDATAARKVKGVVDVLEVPSGVAVVAQGFWPASQGVKALQAQWNEPKEPHPDSAALEQRYRAAMDRPGVIVATAGTLPEAGAKGSVTAEYHAPFLAHAPMEPLNCTAHFRRGELHLWVGTQDQDITLATCVALASLPKDKIHIHTELLGGGFGRRAAVDFIRPAVELALRLKDPVKVVYERSYDIQGHYYRPAALARFEASLDEQGRIAAYRAKVVSPSIMQHFNGQHARGPHGDFDFFATQGLTAPIYPIANRESRWVREETGIPSWVWRGVGLSQNVFFLESFMDELAHAAKQDPFDFRLAHLPVDPAKPQPGIERARKVLAMAREKSGWDTPLPAKDRARGLALHAYNGVYLAVVAEVSIVDQRPKVHHVTFVGDCGRVVNPNIVRQQMEGGVSMGLSMLASKGITFKDGAVEQSNFHDYPVSRMADQPPVECHLIEGSARVFGVGEFTNTTIAPAVANAVFRLTGQRLRRFPLEVA